MSNLLEESTPNINELFAAPIGLEKAGDIHGFTLYTSNILKEKFINAYENSIYKDYAFESVKKLVKEGLITPVFSTRSMIKFFLIRPFQSKKSIITVGFYSPVYKKIFILIDSRANIFGQIIDNLIAETTIHEAIHCLAQKNPKLFLSLFMKDLSIYYKFVYRRMFNTFGLESIEIKPLIYRIFNRFDAGGAGVKFKEFFELMEKYIKSKSDYTSENFDKQLFLYAKAISLFYKENTECFNQFYGFFHECHKKAYMDAFSIDPSPQICYQEAVIPSEVICKISKENFMKSKIIRAIDSL